jgi:hypothetical protein
VLKNFALNVIWIMHVTCQERLINALIINTLNWETHTADSSQPDIVTLLKHLKAIMAQDV